MAAYYKLKWSPGYIVEKGTPGITFGTKEKKIGIRGSATYELVSKITEIYEGTSFFEEFFSLYANVHVQ